MKIVHLADLHLGYRAYNKLDQKGLNVREKDVLKAFKESLDKVVEINPDVVLIAGDVFHKPRPTNTTVYLTIQLLQNFRNKCKAPVLMIAGNHEMYRTVESGSILKVLETSVADLKVVDTNIEQVVFDDLDLNVLCVPYSQMSEVDSTQLKGDKSFKYNIFMIHGSYNSPKCPELSKYSHEALIEEKNIDKNWDYVALGHYHKYVELSPVIFYAGAIERTSTNIWQETEPKGFIEYDLDEKELTFHKLKTPRKVYDIKKFDALNKSAEEIDAFILEQTSNIKDFENSIVRMTIENIDPIAWANLDYKKIRELKKKSVHFRTNFIKKESRLTDKNASGSSEKKDLHTYLEEELQAFELNPILDKKVFEKMAKKYLFNKEVNVWS